MLLVPNHCLPDLHGWKIRYMAYGENCKDGLALAEWYGSLQPAVWDGSSHWRATDVSEVAKAGLFLSFCLFNGCGSSARSVR